MTFRRGSAADLVVVHARVHTVDPAKPFAQAVAVAGERITRVGTNEDVESSIGPDTRVIDAGGRLLLPGFNDAHVHFISGADELVGVNLRPASSEEDFARRLADHAASLPRGEWILGGFWDHEAWPTRALPVHQIIDAATADNPVFVRRLDGHMGVANALAMRLAGIGWHTPDPDGGTIVRDAAGRPTGVLKDNAMALITGAVPPATLDRTMDKARAALRHARSLGVTTVQDMTAGATELRAYQALQARGELTARIYSIQNHGIDGLVGAGVATGFGNDWIRVGGIKLFADGSMGSGTAAFFEPYADDPANRGLLLFTPDALARAIFDADAAGFQLIVHAIGDRANALVLDALERLQRERGVRDRRPRIEHAQVVRPEDRRRFRATGAIASIQPSHCIDDMRWAERRIGPDRCKIAYNVKSFADAGVPVAFGTDWYVEPLNPMVGLYAAVTRQFPDGTPAEGWYPEERITLDRAVEYYTLGSAYAEFAEERKGSLTKGKLADMVLLSKDIFVIPPPEILSVTPLYTIVGGQVVFDAERTS
ncbi:MAG TPA: amidohydrolase [Vicinamibacterales bacterium]